MARTKPYPALRKSVEHRKWLNPKSGSAHITWSVGIPTYNVPYKREKKGTIWPPSMSLSIADCSRKITLDMWGRKPALRKLNMMIDELMEFKSAIEGAYERQKELSVLHPEAKVEND